ncbi:MAG: hypothetical protein ACREFQ_12455 [Stellaceae bacterium]
MVSIHEEHAGMASAVTPVSSVSEAAVAIAVIVLAILGLVGVVPDIMMAVTAIVVGAGILLLGAQSAAEFAQMATMPVVAGGTVAATVGAAAPGGTGGITLDFLAGGTGIVLGIIALFSHFAVLAPAALIVFGCTLLLVGGTMARRRVTATGASAVAEVMAEEMSVVAGGGELMIGIAAIVLGILALIPIHAAVLTLVGLLAVGAGLLMASVGNGGLAWFMRS